MPISLREAARILGVDLRTTTQQECHRAYLNLARKNHPDLHSDAPNATARMQQINGAWEVLKRHFEKGTKRQNKRAQQDQDEAGDASAPPNDAPPFTWSTPPIAGIYVLQTVAGAGKTRTVCAELARERFGKTVVASLTINLMTETEHHLAGSIRRVRSISTKSHPGEVRPTAVRWLCSEPSTHSITVLSHDTALRLPGLLSGDQLKEIDLIVDEEPAIVTFIRVAMADTSWVISSSIKHEEYRPGLLRLEPKNQDDARRRLEYIAANPRNDHAYEGLSQLAEDIADTSKIVLVLHDQWMRTLERAMNRADDTDLLVILGHTSLASFRSVSILAAFFHTTLTSIVYGRLGVSFVPHPLSDRLPTVHGNGKALTIFYMYEDRMSRDALKQLMPEGDTLWDRVFMGAPRFLEARFPGQPWVWTAPQQPRDVGTSNYDYDSRADENDHLRGKAYLHKNRLPGSSRGLNKWRTINIGLFLSVVNLAPQQDEMLAKLGVTEEERWAAFTLQATYQDVCRISIRDPSIEAERAVIVLDRHIADGLVARFPGCSLEVVPAEFVSPRPGRKRGGRPTVGDAPMSDAKRKARSRAQAKQRQQEKERQAEDA